MPDFYSGPSTANSFSQGLMAGYSFVDNIRARRQAEQDRQRQIALQESQEARAKETFSRQKTEWTQEDEDRTTRLQDTADDKLGRLTGSLGLLSGGMDKIDAEDRSHIVEAARHANPSWANDDDDAVFAKAAGLARVHYEPYVAEQVRLNREKDLEADATEAVRSLVPEIEALGNERRGPAPQSPASPSPASAVPSAQPSAPQSLSQVGQRTALPADLNTRAPLVAGQRGGAQEAPAPRQRELPTKTPAPAGVSQGRGGTRISDQELSDEVAQDPSGYAGSWLEKRAAIKDKTVLNKTDEIVSQGLNQAYERSLKARSVTQPGTRDRALVDRAIQKYSDQLDHISKLRTTEVAKTATANGPARGDAAVAAVQNAAAATQTAGPQVVDGDKYRAMTQAANSAATRPGKRLSEVQIKNLGWMVAHGMIKMDDVENKMRYGTFQKPEAPTIHNFGNGYGAVIRGPNITYVKLPGDFSKGKDGEGGKGGVGKLWATEYDRGFSNIRQTIANTYGLNPKDDAEDINTHLNRLISAMATDPLTMASFTDPQGRIRFDQIGSEQAVALTEAYKNWNDNEDASWYQFWKPRGKPYSEYLMNRVAPAGAPAPESSEVIDFADLPQ